MHFAEHFSLRELTHTNTGFENLPNSQQKATLAALSHILEGIRAIVCKPLYINSAFRSVQVNAAVGGSRTSYHLYGNAADISIRNLDKNERAILKRAICAKKPCEFIEYDTFYHVAFDISRLGNQGSIKTWQEEHPECFPAAGCHPATADSDY